MNVPRPTSPSRTPPGTPAAEEDGGPVRGGEVPRPHASLPAPAAPEGPR